MEVLKNRSQIADARQILKKKGVSSIESITYSFLRRFGLKHRVVLGDYLKSWDVSETLGFIERNIKKNEPILDIGCYASEIIVALYKLGYTNLTGADLNAALKEMPYQNAIHYEVCNFMKTPFLDASFKVITSISVIEHGFDEHALLKEISRLLQLTGYFIASFDYWSEKIDTNEIQFFGMDWKIFSKQEIEDFVEQAAKYKLVPVGDFHYECQDAPIECSGKKYTFGWIVFKKVD
ncbi:MAG: class I SAM-dependent methyltransferase [Pseudomonadota bacterium]|nr:class I SAM-dependent methyltransferase [Pseudomonadota bacterium]